MSGGAARSHHRSLETVRSRQQHRPNLNGPGAALATARTSAGRLAEAAAAYRQILPSGPTSPKCTTDWESCLAIQGQIDEAATRFEQAITLKQTWPRPNQPGHCPPKSGKPTKHRPVRATLLAAARLRRGPQQSGPRLLSQGQSRSRRTFTASFARGPILPRHTITSEHPARPGQLDQATASSTGDCPLRPTMPRRTTIWPTCW